MTEVETLRAEVKRLREILEHLAKVIPPRVLNWEDIDIGAVIAAALSAKP